jgi:hypothetical protein
MLEAGEVPAPAVGLMVGLDLADRLTEGDLAKDRRKLSGGGQDVLPRAAGPVVTVSDQPQLPPSVLDGVHRSLWLVRESRTGGDHDGTDGGMVFTALEQRGRVVDAGLHPLQPRPLPAVLLQPVGQPAGPAHGIDREVGALHPRPLGRQVPHPTDRAALVRQASGLAGDHGDVGQRQDAPPDQRLQEGSAARKHDRVLGGDVRHAVGVVREHGRSAQNRALVLGLPGQPREPALELGPAGRQQDMHLPPVGHANPRGVFRIRAPLVPFDHNHALGVVGEDPCGEEPSDAAAQHHCGI